MQPHAAFGVASALQQLGRYKESLEAFDYSLSLGAMRVEILNNKAYIFNALNQYEKALESIDQALELQPNDSNLWNSKGEIYRDQQKYEEASEAFERAVLLSPEDDVFRIDLIYMLYHLKQYDSALAELDKIKNINQDMELSQLKTKIVSVLDRRE